MPSPEKADHAYALAAELGALLGSRKATLEFERRFAASDQADRLNRAMFEIRVADARLKGALADPLASASALGSLAAAAADELEAEAAELAPLLGPEAAGRRFGLLRLVCAMERLARLGDARSRACFTAAREGRRLPGFEDALELAQEDELYFLALRRFEALLAAGKVWDMRDADWLRLRVALAPGRMRLHAANLRSAAELVAGHSLPPALAEARAPFIQLGFEPATALAWAVAGFAPKEALAWGEAGLSQAEQAQPWHERGLSPQEATAWVQADFLADEAAAFKACGATDPATARELRQALGDVEHLLAWHRAGYEVAEVLKLRHQGVMQPPEAAKTAEAGEAPAPSFKISRGSSFAGLTASVPVVEAPPPLKLNFGRVLVDGVQEEKPLPPIAVPPAKAEGEVPAAVPAPAAPAPPPRVEVPAPVEGIAPVARVLKAATTWAQERAQARFGIECPDQAAALAARPAQGGAWLFWGAHQAGGDAAAGGGWDQAATLPMNGGLADVVLASEQVLPPQGHVALGSLEPGEAWQVRLDKLRAMRQAAPLPGHWQLAGWPPQSACFFWGLIFEGTQPPWADAVDYEERETWQHRWARKAEEWGEEGLASPCNVGRTPKGGWWVALPESVVRSPEGGVVGMEPRWPSPAWRSGLEDFCLKMEMGAQTAHWYLLCMPANQAF